MKTTKPTHEQTKANAKTRAPEPPIEKQAASAGLQPEKLVQQAMGAPATLTPGNILQLQRLVGNRAVSQMLQAAASPQIQPKLTVVPKQEAAQVIAMPPSSMLAVQRVTMKDLEPLKKEYGTKLVEKAIGRIGRPTADITVDEIRASITADKDATPTDPAPTTQAQASVLAEEYTEYIAHLKAEAGQRLDEAIPLLESVRVEQWLPGLTVEELKVYLLTVRKYLGDLNVSTHTGGPAIGITGNKPDRFPGMAPKELATKTAGGRPRELKPTAITLNTNYLKPRKRGDPNDSSSNLFRRTWTLIHEATHAILGATDALTYFSVDYENLLEHGRPPKVGLEGPLYAQRKTEMRKNADTYAALVMTLSNLVRRAQAAQSTPSVERAQTSVASATSDILPPLPSGRPSSVSATTSPQRHQRQTPEDDML